MLKKNSPQKSTTIAVSNDTYKRLNAIKDIGVSFEYVIIELLDYYKTRNAEQKKITFRVD